MAQTSNLGGSFIFLTIKKVLDEFSTADEENEGTTESEVTGCILKGGSFEMLWKEPPHLALVQGS